MDHAAYVMLLYSMQNDLLNNFEVYQTANEMWKALKEKFDVTSSTRLRNLMLKFNGYCKLTNHTMK